jgi:hypothetical protein
MVKVSCFFFLCIFSVVLAIFSKTKRFSRWFLRFSPKPKGLMKNGLRERLQLVKTFQMNKKIVCLKIFFCSFSQWFLRFSLKQKGLMKNGLRERVQLVKTFQMNIKHSMFENFFFLVPRFSWLS